MAAPPSVLIYSRTVDYRHDSIPTAIAALARLAPQYNVSFTASEDPALFTAETLAQFQGIVFLSNSGNVLDGPQREAFQGWLDKGGRLSAIHAGCACLFDANFFREQVGALFDFHPALQLATFLPLNKTHPSMTMIPDRWTFEEEVYYFRSDPRTVGAQVLMTVDEASYTVGDAVSTGSYPSQGTPHPIAWYQDAGAGANPASDARAGRSWFTSLGHTNATWADETFLAHVMEGITWTIANESGTASLSTTSETAPSTTAASRSSSTATPSSSTSSPLPSSGGSRAITAGGGAVAAVAALGLLL